MVTKVGQKKEDFLQVLPKQDDLIALTPTGIAVLKMTFEEFRSQLKTRNHTLKSTLTDPELFSEIGNAYETNYCPRCQADGKLLADRSLSRLLKNDWPKTIDELEQLSD